MHCLSKVALTFLSPSILFCAWIILFIDSSWVQASDKKSEKVFVVIPKFTHAFFERTKRGCIFAAKSLEGVSCRYEPPRSFDVREQVRILEDMLSIGVDGIAIAPISSAAIGRALRQSNTKKVPIVTFDSDLRAEDRYLRYTYIGSNNFSIGVELARMLNEIRPEGGLLLIQAGEPPAENLKERLEGFLSHLENFDLDVNSVHSRKWKQVPGSPMYCDASEQIAVRQLEDTLGAYPELSAFVALGAWPQVAKRGYKQALKNQKMRIDSNQLVLLAADTLDMQIELLAEGYTQGLVGQRPFEMGAKSIRVLYKIINKEVADIPDPIYTGLDICTSDNLSSCINEGDMASK
ncbi:MAG TPA: substrate-binding domain-containing protein [Oligoflexia bacterium]|nr:substrate-binding domain-containing protein [Oligoflexia bacterium]